MPSTTTPTTVTRNVSFTIIHFIPNVLTSSITITTHIAITTTIIYTITNTSILINTIITITFLTTSVPTIIIHHNCHQNHHTTPSIIKAICAFTTLIIQPLPPLFPSPPSPPDFYSPSPSLLLPPS